MSHIPAKAMPHARAHDDAHADSDTFAQPLKQRHDATTDTSSRTHGSGASLAAFALGGVLAVGLIAALALPSLTSSKSQADPKKSKRRKSA